MFSELILIAAMLILAGTTVAGLVWGFIVTKKLRRLQRGRAEAALETPPRVPDLPQETVQQLHEEAVQNYRQAVSGAVQAMSQQLQQASAASLEAISGASRQAEQQLQQSVAGATGQIEQTLAAAPKQFQADLTGVHEKLNQLSETIAADLQQQSAGFAEKELGAISGAVDEAIEQLKASLMNAKQQVDQRHAELEQVMAQGLQTEQERLLAALDHRIGDIVSSYILEGLGHNVDLEAQTKAVIDMLEKNKENLKRDILNAG